MYRRIALGCLGVVVLLLAGVWGLWYFTTGTLLPPDYRKPALEGQPIVQAILEFRQQNGIWPLTLDELVPAYLPTLPPKTWIWNFPGLLRHADMPHTGIHFNVIPPDACWVSEGDFGTGKVAVAAPATTRPAPSPAKQIANALTVLDARIAREPGERLHCLNKVVFLVHQKKNPEALNAARQAGVTFPNDWYFQMVQAELTEGDAKKVAETDFSAWAVRTGIFNDCWYLSTYYRQHSQSDQALRALEEAAKCPVVRSRREDSYVPDYFCFDAAAFACKMGKFDLTLKLCDRWDELIRSQGYGDEDSAILRAAACSGLGRKLDAQTFLARAKPNGWCHDLPRLKVAVAAGDASFIYDADSGSHAALLLFESQGLDE